MQPGVRVCMQGCLVDRVLQERVCTMSLTKDRKGSKTETGVWEAVEMVNYLDNLQRWTGVLVVRSSSSADTPL